MSDEEFEAGMKARREVLGDEHVERAVAQSTAFTAPFQDFITRYAWGSVWTREGLDRRTRSAVTLAVLTALGAGLWLSALNAIYRDVRYVVPFLVQFWMFASPVAYPSSLVPERWRWVYGLNPMVGVVEGFRWALLGSNVAPGPIIAASACASLVILITGAFYFRRNVDGDGHFEGSPFFSVARSFSCLRRYSAQALA